MGHDASGVLHSLGDGQGLPARSRAKIQNALTWLRIEQLHRHQGAGILDIKPSLAEGTQGFQSRMAGQRKDRIGIRPIHLNRGGFDSLDLPSSHQGLRGGPKPVHPSDGGRRGIVPGQQSLKISFAQDSNPPLHQPIGMRPSQRGILRP